MKLISKRIYKEQITQTNMNKRIMIMGIVLLLLVPLVFANDEKKTDVTNETKNFTKEEIKQELKQASEKEINLPKFVSLPLSIKEDKIGIHYLIIMGTFILILFIILFNAYQFIPFFENKFLIFMASFVSILILSFTGIIKNVAVEFFDFWNLFGFLEDWTILQIIISILLSLFVLGGVLKLIHWIKRDYELTEAEFKGTEAGVGLRLMRDKYKQERAKIGELI